MLDGQRLWVLVSMGCLGACGGGAETQGESASGGSGASAATGGTGADSSGGSGGSGATATGGGGGSGASSTGGAGGAAASSGGSAGAAGGDAGAAGAAGAAGEECPTGYTGETCSDCAAGYTESSGQCVGVCSVTNCGNGTCTLDSVERPVCVCDAGWAGAACSTCAVGYRPGVVVIGDPPVCELDTPATTNMALWLDADHAASFTLGTGNTVLRWYSRVPGDATYFSDGGLSSARPVRAVPTRGERPRVTFDGTDDRLRRLVDLRTDTYSIYMVVEASAAKSTQTLLSGVRSSTSAHGLQIQARDSADTIFLRHQFPFGGTTLDDMTRPSYSTASPTIVEVHRGILAATPVYQIYNGSGYTSMNGTAGAFDENVMLYLGIRGDSQTFPLAGSVGELIIFRAVVPLTDRDEVRSYLTAKWLD